MKSAVETLDPTKVKLTVEVTYDELKPSIEHAYKHIAQQVERPGLPQGQGPAAHHRPARRSSRGARARGQRRAVRLLRRGGPTRTSCARSGQPEVEVTEVPAEAPGEEGELHFTAEVEVRPEIEIPALDGIEVTVDDVEVSDEDVAEPPRRAARALRHPRRRRPPGRRRRLRRHRPHRDDRRRARSTTVSGVSYQSARATCSTGSTRRSRACRPARPRRSRRPSRAASTRARSRRSR